VTNAVLENQTGGENQQNGPGNIIAINTSAQKSVASFKPPQSTFANYNLVGTVWMLPNSYNLNSDQTSAVGSVDLANVTAETFVQNAKILRSAACRTASCATIRGPIRSRIRRRRSWRTG
jgi:hypothetical protein